MRASDCLAANGEESRMGKLQNLVKPPRAWTRCFRNGSRLKIGIL